MNDNTIKFELPSNFWKSLDSISSRILTATQRDLGHSESEISSLAKPTVIVATTSNMDQMDHLLKNHIVLTSDFINRENITEQMEYDKLMNEIWIGIVLTLIIISMVFCICSCFLYHQFRLWKLNFRNSHRHGDNLDIESAKLNPSDDDPVPEYSLVSGLPSYDAALELLNKSPKCVVVYPTVFNVFHINENSKEKPETSEVVGVHHHLLRSSSSSTEKDEKKTKE
ncbi:hypothetical protein ACFFRR_010482 [Megaselia abdita]